MGQGEQSMQANTAIREPAQSVLAPSARAFMTEVAEARRIRRQVMPELDPSSELFQAMTGANRSVPVATAGWLEPFPGASDDSAHGARHEQEGNIPETAYLLLPDVEARRFGLNNVQAYRTIWVADPDGLGGWLEDDLRFGIDGESILDAGRLGVDVIRHHGEHDLFWFMLAQEPTLLDTIHTSSISWLDQPQDPPFTLPVPLQADIPQAIRYGHQAGRELSTYLQYNYVLIAAVLGKAKTAGLKLVLNFLSRGGGGGTTGAAVPPTAFDPADVEYSIQTSTKTAEINRNGSFADLLWSTDHNNQGSPAGEPYAFPIKTASSLISTSAWDWYLSSLDPACPYKREYVGYIAQAVARLLVAAGAQAEIGDLSRVVEAVEVFNEADARDPWVLVASPEGDPATAGEKWGRAYLHAAKGLRAGGLPASVRITLPGLSSYHDDVRAMHWSDRLAFVGGLIEGIVQEANDRYYLWGALSPDEILQDLGSLVQGIDLHWYHHEATEGPTHIGNLVLEVGELRDTILDGLRRYSPPVDLADFEDFPITMFESGWSLDGSIPADMTPEVWTEDWGSQAAELSFQAFEVWRRLGGALAGGAVIAGWHPWASRGSETFARMGLRRDDMAVEVASDAIPRPAWFAYAVLTEVLGGRVKTAGMVLPQVSSRTELGRKLALDPERTSVVVLEFGLDAPSSREVMSAEWAYMVLLDPTALELPHLLALGTPSSTARRGEAIREYRGSWYHTSGFIHPGSDTELPYNDEVHADSASRPVMPFALYIGREPRLFVSPVRLDWKLTQTLPFWDPVHPASTSHAATTALYQIPAWFDDPGVPLPDRKASQATTARGRK